MFSSPPADTCPEGLMSSRGPRGAEPLMSCDGGAQAVQVSHHLFERRNRMRYPGLILMLVVLTAGCDRSRAELTKALAESRAAEAQKDSLLTEVLETTQFVSDLNSELAKAKA